MLSTSYQHVFHLLHPYWGIHSTSLTTGHDYTIVIRTVTSSYCLQGHHRITYRSWAKSLIVFTEIYIRKPLHVRNIWEITMTVSSSQQAPTAVCYFNPQWIFQQPVIKLNEGELDIQQKAVILKVITLNCGLWLFSASPLQLNNQKIASPNLQWYTFPKWHFSRLSKQIIKWIMIQITPQLGQKIGL